MTARSKGSRTRTTPSKSKTAGHPSHLISARGARALARVRKICATLPEVTEKEAWGSPTFRVRNKLFCHFHDNHHGDGRIAIWCKATRDDQELLVGSNPERFFVPPYVGPSGWVGMLLEKPDWALTTEVLTNAYRMNASKKQLKLLGDFE